MENKKRALGKGLEELFNTENIDLNRIETKIMEESTADEIVEINLSELRANPYQPRQVFDEAALAELAQSIKEHGVFQPIIVKKSIRGYEIIAGERRCRASKMAGKETIPAIIRDLTDEQMMHIALLENLQREDLSAIEEAKAYKSIIDKTDITQEELARKIGKSRSHVTNILGLLKLPTKIQGYVMNSKLSMGHARVLSKLENEEDILRLSEEVLEKDLSVRELESIVSNNYKKTNKVTKRPKDNTYNYVEDILKEKFGTKVSISDNKVHISFSTPQDLNRILEIIDVKIGD